MEVVNISLVLPQKALHLVKLFLLVGGIGPQNSNNARCAQDVVVRLQPARHDVRLLF
jgi:hypothetical protein